MIANVLIRQNSADKIIERRAPEAPGEPMTGVPIGSIAPDIGRERKRGIRPRVPGPATLSRTKRGIVYLTYHPSKSSKSERNRPVITHEMIQVGRRVLWESGLLPFAEEGDRGSR